MPGSCGVPTGAPRNAPGACTTSDVTESAGRPAVPTVDFRLPKAHAVPLLHASRRDSFCRALFGLQLSRAVRLLGSRLQNRETANTTFVPASSAGPSHRLRDVRDLPFSLTPGCGPTPPIQLPSHVSPSNLGDGDAARPSSRALGRPDRRRPPTSLTDGAGCGIKHRSRVSRGAPSSLPGVCPATAAEGRSHPRYPMARKPRQARHAFPTDCQS